MKFKIIILLILSIFITYLIYKTTPPHEIKITSIYDKTTNSNYPYNTLLKEYFQKNSIKYDESLSENNLEIENVVDKIIENQNNIKKSVKESDLIIINLGFYETSMSILYNTNISKEILEDTNDLYKQLRKITTSPIIFVGPVNISVVLNNALKNLSEKYNVNYITNNYYTAEELKDNIIKMVKKELKIEAIDTKTVANDNYYII